MTTNVSMEKVSNTLEFLAIKNSRIQFASEQKREFQLQKVLVANRGEIAKRFFFSLKEENIPSVAIVTDPDIGQSWYEFADEVVFIGDAKGYSNIETVLASVIFSNANAVYPGYGFLSENPEFVRGLKEISDAYGKKIIFMGPKEETMRSVGDKVAARNLAKKAGIPLFEGSEILSSFEELVQKSGSIGFPVILKLSAGGGGKGMVPVYEESSLREAWDYSRRIGEKLYKDSRVYLEKFITSPVHIEVQIFNGTAIGTRKCAVQRKNQKVIEESGDWFLSDHQRLQLLSSAEAMAQACGYNENCAAGTVEFLLDQSTGKFGFLEMNTRLQVEHPVTDQSFGIDLAKWQVLLFDDRFDEKYLEQIRKQRFANNEHSIECRMYAEDPENDYSPSTGRIQEIDLPTFNGVRCDFGFMKGDTILPDYDPMIGKIIAKGPTRQIAISRMRRALSEFYIRGVITNWSQLTNILDHKAFLSGDYTNKLLDDHPQITHPICEILELKEASAYGAIAEMITLNFQEANEAVISKSDMADKKHYLSSLFYAETENEKWDILLIQKSTYNFSVIIGEKWLGEIQATQKSSQFTDFWIQNGRSSFPIRIEKRRDEIFLKMPSQGRKTKIFRFRMRRKIETENTALEVRAPFTGNFVRFVNPGTPDNKRIQAGFSIQKGDPIITISAMKMETTILSPFAGKIDFLIENGHPEKLQLGKTPEGMILGKTITEGELLFSVTNEIQDTARPKKSYTSFFMDKDIRELLVFLKEYFSGFSSTEIDWKLISEKIADPQKEIWPDVFKNNENLILNIISIYTLSFSLNKDQKNELTEFCRKHEKSLSQFSDEFQFCLAQFGKIQGEEFLRLTTSVQADERALVFHIIRKSYVQSHSESSRNILKFFLQNFCSEVSISKKLIQLLKNLLIVEKSQSDDTIYRLVEKILESKNIPVSLIHRKRSFSRKYFSEYRSLTENPFQLFKGMEQCELENEIQSSLKNPERSLITNDMPEELKRIFSDLIFALGDTHILEKYFSPRNEFLIIGSSNRSAPENKSYTVYICTQTLRPEFSTKGGIEGSPELEEGTILASALILCYQKFDRRVENQIEFISYAQETPVILLSENQNCFQYSNLMNIGQKVNYYLHIKPLSLSGMLIHIHHKDKAFSNRDISICLENSEGKVIPGLLHSHSTNNKYGKSGATDADLRVFQKGKWTPEIWAKFSFDGSFEEILIPSVDYEKNSSERLSSVGSIIYKGQIEGSKAIFYFKDSRINGGSTGDKEGLKYVAAVYLAYRMDLPLYIWNDGAGANIKEGMVSLNRAGEGFMVNALVGKRVTLDKWKNWISNHYDEKLKNLIQTLDGHFSFRNSPEGKSFIVTLGVGSSTGLDVYGSSQAAIQIMLDEKESYRVLTGSQVIRSVTGENLTNYEIGGAQIMGAETGTVDLVARDKIHLMFLVHRVQQIFAGKKCEDLFFQNHCKSTPKETESDQRKQFFQSSTYLDFKKEYLNTENLIAGFGTFKGHPVLFAQFSNQIYEHASSIYRLRELHRIAKKTNSAELFVFDKQLNDNELIKNPNTAKARLDLEKTLSTRSLFRIHILLSPESFCHPIHAGADVLIYVDDESGEKNSHWLRKTSTITTTSSGEAIQLAGDIIHFLKNRKEKTSDCERLSNTEISLPPNASEGFDVRTDVIEKIFDHRTIIEFYADWNDPLQGPGLFTGLARLNGETVGIIADQPLIISGAADAAGTEKFRLFTEFLNHLKIPLVMLSNAPGFYPGTKQEKMRIQQIGGESLDINVLGEIPVVSVVLRQNYGGRQIHAFSPALRPGISYIAFDDSILSVMGAGASFDLFLKKKYNELIERNESDAAVKLKENYINEFNEKSSAKNDAYRTGLIDWLIKDPNELREDIVRAMKLAKERAATLLN